MSRSSGDQEASNTELLLIASLVAMPFAPSSFLLLVVRPGAPRPGAPSSVFAPSRNALAPSSVFVPA